MTVILFIISSNKTIYQIFAIILLLSRSRNTEWITSLTMYLQKLLKLTQFSKNDEIKKSYSIMAWLLKTQVLVDISFLFSHAGNNEFIISVEDCKKTVSHKINCFPIIFSSKSNCSPYSTRYSVYQVYSKYLRISL